MNASFIHNANTISRAGEVVLLRIVHKLSFKILQKKNISAKVCAVSVFCVEFTVTGIY